VSQDLRRLRDAATVMRHLAGPDRPTPLQEVFAVVGDWLEDTARYAGYTKRGIDLEHAHRVADAILAAGEPERHAPLTDEPCGVIPTQAGAAAVNAYRAHRTQQHPRTSGGPS